VLRNHGAGTYILYESSSKRRSSIVLARILSALACVVGSAPSSAPIIQKTVRPVNRPPFPLFQSTLGIGETIMPIWLHQWIPSHDVKKVSGAEQSPVNSVQVLLITVL
jgi:hypothetical protein